MRRHLLWDGPVLGSAAVAAAAGVPGVAAGLLAAWGLGHARAVAHPRSQLYGPVRWRLADGLPQVALTFDDGPDPRVTPRVLDLLAEHGATATFFVVGAAARRHPDLLARLVAEGHGLGLHSDGHDRAFTLRSPARQRADLVANAAALPVPTRWFRPPVGLRTPPLVAVVADLGLTTVTWSINARDTGGPVDLPRLLAALGPGSIVLGHDGADPWHPDRPRTRVLEWLPAVLAHCRAQGWAVVSLDRAR